ncbi:uncharacterized protein LOC143475210 isoform X2 [Brachyhypopomus gauderio]|uniref:uncharacterized protein LOC143475210 isoform X2 n=1 Tax=Brachyhypopomus gauderio TaxID=698409 RepID=UPI004042F297
MEDIYSNKNIRKHTRRAAGDTELSNANSESHGVIYSEVCIVDSNQNRAAAANEEAIYSNVAISNPGDLSASHLPGPNDSDDASPETRSKVISSAQVNGRLLISLCVFFFATAVITAVLYGFGKVSYKESENQVKDLREKNENLVKEMEDLSARETSWVSQLSEKNRSIKQLQTEKKNLTRELEDLREKTENLGKQKEELSARETSLVNQLTERSRNIEKLQVERVNLTKELQDLREKTKNLGKEKEDLSVRETSLVSQLSERNRSIEQLLAEKENLTRELQALKDKPVNCAVGWKLFSRRCYYFSKDQKTWTESRDACIAEGGDLVIINNKEEKDFLQQSKPVPGKMDYWIGLTDAVKENDWRWLDGTKRNIKLISWAGTEPDNWNDTNKYPDGEDCAVMELESNGCVLRDAFCDEASKKHSYICEAKAGK